MPSHDLYAAEVADWTCSCLTIVCLLVRAWSIWQRREFRDAVTPLVSLSFCFLIARVVCNTYILKYGTVDDLEQEYAGNPSDIALQHYQMGSKLSLIARVLVTSFYWLQGSLLLLLYRRLLYCIPWVRKTISFCWALIVVTYIAVILTTVLECRPISLNWKLSAHPISCARAYGQLLTQGLSNIAIDLVLLTISTPILRIHGRSRREKARIGLLFTLGTFCIVVTCIRCWNTFDNQSSQVVRSFWASIQAAVAAWVANAPAIYGSLRLVYRQKVSARSDNAVGGAADAWRDYALMDTPTKAGPVHGTSSDTGKKQSSVDCWRVEDIADDLQCDQAPLKPGAATA